MKQILSVFLIVCMIFSLCSCSKQEMVDMSTEINGDYVAIVWEDKTYVPYCAVAKVECGAQIGIVDGDKDDRVYEYKDYSSDEWIVNSYSADGAMLLREITATSIPDGLESEYEWN